MRQSAGLTVSSSFTRSKPQLTQQSSALKRTKAYRNLEDVHPTLRDKPSGLQSDWHRTVSKSSASHHRTPAVHARSSSSSFQSSSSSVQSSSSSVQSSSSSALMSPAAPIHDGFDHTSSLLAMLPPPAGSSLSPLSRRDLVPPIDIKPSRYQESLQKVFIPRSYCVILKTQSSSLFHLCVLLTNQKAAKDLG